MDIYQLPNMFFFPACDILAIDKSLTPVTLVLAEDGTIVDDDDYFLCLPSNTKFVALASNEKWTYSNSGKKLAAYTISTMVNSYCTVTDCYLSGALSIYSVCVYLKTYLSYMVLSPGDKAERDLSLTATKIHHDREVNVTT